MEGGRIFNALNFNVDYNEATGMNFTGASTVVPRLPLPLGDASDDWQPRRRRPQRPDHRQLFGTRLRL